MNENTGTTVFNEPTTLAGDGTWEGSGNTWVAGKFGSGINFNGSGGITIADSNVFNITSWTILMYVKFGPGADGNTEGLFLQADGSTNWAFLTQNGKLLGRETNSATNDIIGSVLISSKSYVCVAYRRTSGVEKSLFVNGSRDTKCTGDQGAQGDAKSITDNPEIGCNGGCGNNNFIGSIDQVLMYNIALTNGEINNLCSVVGNTVTVDQ